MNLCSYGARRVSHVATTLLSTTLLWLTVPPQTATAVSLQDLIDGAALTVEDKIFDSWELFFLDSSATPLPDLSQVDVVPLIDQPNNPGVKFNTNGQLSVVGENFIDLEFGFRVATLNGLPLIKDNSLAIPEDGFSFGSDGGLIVIAEDILDASGGDLGDKLVEADQGLGFFDLFDSADFPVQAEVFVEKFISIEVDSASDSVSLDMFVQRFSQIPEPAGLLLALIATVFGVSFACRRGASRRPSNS